MSKKNAENESKYYAPVKAKLEQIIGARFTRFHVEITAKRKFSNALKITDIMDITNDELHFTIPKPSSDSRLCEP